MKSRLNTLAQKAYNIHTDVNVMPSLVNSSSSGQTATCVAMPTTPILSNTNPTGMAQRQMSGPKVNRHGAQPLLTRDSQAQFHMMQPRVPGSVSYGPQGFSDYAGSQLASVSRTAISDSSQALANFDWSFDIPNNWAGLQYPMQIDTENQELSYMQHEEQN